MTNGEIARKHGRNLGAKGFELMELARADEREQIIKKIEFERDNVRGLQNDYTKILHILFDAVIKIMKYDIRGDYDK